MSEKISLLPVQLFKMVKVQILSALVMEMT